MIEYTYGDLLKAKVDALVNPVNCVGVMGRGLALQFKRSFPDNFKAYARACKQGEVQPGRMFVFETCAGAHPRVIINFPTKRHWRDKSRMADIDAGLDALRQTIPAYRLTSLALPALGCGLGGLPWQDVKSRIDSVLAPASVRILVFEPPTAPPYRVSHPMQEALTPGRGALLRLMHRYLQGMLDPLIGPPQLHLLLYFLQAAGEPLRLNYRPGPDGPHAENLENVFRAMEGRLITGFDQHAPGATYTLMPGALAAAERLLRRHPDTLARCARVARLVDGFESVSGLALLARTHWLAEGPSNDTSETQTDPDAADPSPFSQAQSDLALRVLIDQGWIDTKRRRA